MPAVAPRAQTADPQLPSVTVTAPRPLEAASELRVPGATLNSLPIIRPGEVLEAAPGLIVTQHSGEGKANQYFLRGFNLDHGTDLAITFDGMPVNMPTHGHGQGYADVNWLIPELVDEVFIRKGPYYADEGDFSSAGAVHVNYSDRLARNFVAATGGSYGYARGLAAGSMTLGNGVLTGAGEFMFYNGPWDIPDNARKFNGFLRYREGTRADGFAVTAMAYTNSWHSTDQIPTRAVAEGIIDRLGSIDPTDGGDTQRYSLSARWSRSGDKSTQRVEAYAIYSTLNLYNNFTYFLDDPVNGDQFQQSDKRFILGLKASNTFNHMFAGFAAETQVGLQVRYDNIQVGLFNTVSRTPISTVLQDHVNETSIGLYGQTGITWNGWFRSTLGLRGDLFLASVASNTPSNSGDVTAFLPSPKLGLVFGPFAGTEFFVNAGLGYHSNDARGATITVDPVTGTPQQAVPLLVRSKGAEIGARTLALKGLESSVAFFVLDFDSEIVFAGDSGTTEPSRPSQRIGVEWTNHYQPVPWLLFDVDLAWTQARFTNDDPVGNFIPGAPAFVASAGLALGEATGWYGGLRLRYFGPRPLIEDGSVYSNPTPLLSGRLGYLFGNGVRLQLDVFNLLNTQASQIDYYYASQLRNESSPVNDVHFHPVEPLAFRVTMMKYF
jgi:TonB-dependent Receptor Plug Domain